MADLKKNVEEIWNEAYKKGIHPVCFLCKKPCKKPYAFWSFQMPPNIFCEEFEEGE